MKIWLFWLDNDDLAKYWLELSGFLNPKFLLFCPLKMWLLAPGTCWNQAIKFRPIFKYFFTSCALKLEIFGFGRVWSQSFIRPSPPIEAKTFYEEGCHWTWLQFFIWAGRVNDIFAVYVFPIWTEPSIQPTMNRGELYEHSTECTSALRGMTQALFLPISQNDTSEFPDPISKNLSLCSNHEISNTASWITLLLPFLR